MMQEQWRPLAEYPRYEVSDHGRLRIRVSKHKSRIGSIVRQTRDKKTGYMRTMLFTGKRPYHNVLVHRLVLAAFRGEPPTADHQAAHGDGDRANNTIGNLRWATRSENMHDKKLHGTEGYQKGESNYAAKLTEAQVREILTHPKRYGTGVMLAAKFGVCPQLVNEILRRKRWAHVT